VLLLAGRYGLGDGGWGNSALAQALPVHLPVKRSNDFVQAPLKAQLTDYGVLATALRFDASPEKNTEQWQGLPDLANYHRVGALRPGAVVLVEGVQRGEGATGTAPLLMWQRFGRGSAYVLATASTQRWQMSLPSEDQRHELFWRQLLHALADQSPQQAWVSTAQSIYNDERSVRVMAELRDHAFEPIDAAKVLEQVEVIVVPDSGAPIRPALRVAATQPDRLVAEFDASAAGLYKVELTARTPDAQVLTASTAFRRDDDVVEHFEPYQHRATLERVARETQGRYWSLGQLAALGESIPYTKSGIVERQMLDLWNIPFVFLLIALLKLGEWALRLKWGTL
jgi:hypothetical protein